MSFVGNLPFDVYAVIFSKWIRMSDLCKLDTSLCYKSFRMEFLECLCSEKTTFNLEDTFLKKNTNLYCWLEIKRMSLECLWVSDESKISNQLLQSRVALSQVLNLYIYSGYAIHGPALHSLITLCTGLTSIGLRFPSHVLDANFVELFCNKVNSSLTHFSCGDETNVSDSALVALGGNCPCLTSLSISGRLITDYGFTNFVKSCPQLKRLSITHGSQISEVVFIDATAKYSKRLTTFQVHGQILSCSSWVKITTNCRKLTSLNLYNVDFTFDAFDKITKNCREVLEINLNSSHLTDSVIILICQRCLKLTSLTTLSTNVISSKALNEMSKHCKNLTDFSLDINQPNVTLRFLVALVNFFRKIKLTRLCFVHIQLTDKLFKWIAPNLTFLSNLTVDNNLCITDLFLMYLGNSCVSLKFLYMANSVLTSKFGVIYLIMQCPKLEVFIVTFENIMNTLEFSKLKLCFGHRMYLR